MNIANVAHFGTGFLNGLRIGQDMVARARERREAEQYRNDLDAAHHSVQIQTGPTMIGGKPGTMDNRDVGGVGEAPVQAQMAPKYAVGSTTYDSLDAAKQAQAQYNNSFAKAQRIADVIARRDPVKAQQYLTNVMDADEKMKLRAAKEFDAQLMDVSDFQSLTDWMSASKADGMGGKMKFAHHVGQDGKVQFALLGPDGTQTPLHYTFENNAKGLLTAQLMLARSISPADKLKHMLDEREAAQHEKLRDIQTRNAQNDDRRADARLGMEGQRLQWQGQETAMQLQSGYQRMGQDNTRFSWDTQEHGQKEAQARKERDPNYRSAVQARKQLDAIDAVRRYMQKSGTYNPDNADAKALQKEYDELMRALKVAEASVQQAEDNQKARDTQLSKTLKPKNYTPAPADPSPKP